MIIVTGLIVFAVPQVAELFDRMRERGELPWVTDALLSLSDFLGSYGLFVLAALGAAGYGLSQWLATDRGKQATDRFRLSAPLLGPISRSLSVARLCRVLGTLIKGGVPIVRALDIAADSAGNRILSSVVREAAENIKSGETPRRTARRER